MNEQQPEDAAPAGPPESKRGRRRPVFVPVILLVVAAAVAWGGYVWITGKGDEFDFRRFAFLGKKELKVYPADGQVFFNDEPLRDGYVEAVPADGSRDADRIIGQFGGDGKFKLYTDVGGKLSEGAPAGEYKLLLVVYYPTRPLQPAEPMLPAEYYDPAKTLVTITVSDDPEKNHFIVKESGEIQPKRGERQRPRNADRETQSGGLPGR